MTPEEERAAQFVRNGMEIVTSAVVERMGQTEVYSQAFIAALAAIRAGKDEAGILIAVGDSFFKSIKETCQ